uniref:Uncharacterized protein n=1 Tax=Pristionchus pacificus TaxID=54126 RepID=A0A2A6CID8_PRIPA|eukprot:PDM77994.1 hypothetical protein PRIPAC_35183 [Pristionchus pacificus]
MAPLRKRKHDDNKLDQLLRQGAANKKVDIDKAIVNSNERLLKERIVYTKSLILFDSVDDFKDSKIIVLDPSNEEAARKRVAAKLAAKFSSQLENRSKDSRVSRK